MNTETIIQHIKYVLDKLNIKYISVTQYIDKYGIDSHIYTIHTQNRVYELYAYIIDRGKTAGKLHFTEYTLYKDKTQDTLNLLTELNK